MLRKAFDFWDGSRTYIVNGLAGTLSVLLWCHVIRIPAATDSDAIAGAAWSIINIVLRSVTWKPGALSGATLVSSPDSATQLVVKPA